MTKSKITTKNTTTANIVGIEAKLWLPASMATTMGSIQRVHLTAAKVLTSPCTLLDATTRTKSLLLDQLIANSTKSRTLATQRDKLLPKLLRGNLCVERPTNGLSAR